MAIQRGGRAQRRKACTGKIKYASQEEAISAARNILRTHNDHMWPYKCGCHGCGMWHLGHRSDWSIYHKK